MKKLLERQDRFAPRGVVRSDKSAGQLRGFGATEQQLFVGDLLREGGEGVLQRAMEGADALVRQLASRSLARGGGGAHAGGRAGPFCLQRMPAMLCRRLVVPPAAPASSPPGPHQPASSCHTAAGHRHVGGAQNQLPFAGARDAGQAVQEGGGAPLLHLQGGPGAPPSCTAAVAAAKRGT